MKRILRFTLLYPLLALLVYLTLRGGLNYSGFCWAEKRWLSDEEMRVKIVEYVNKHPELCYYDREASDLRGNESCLNDHGAYIKYFSAGQILSRYPACCSKSKERRDPIQGSSIFLERITGFYDSHWTVIYPMKFAENKKIERLFFQNITQSVISDNCAASIYHNQL